MKTLDEVIKKMETCDSFENCSDNCPYFNERCTNDPDALQYLKEYHEIEDEYYELKDWWAEEYVINDPLDWEELKQMEGKPVWVEPVKEWMLITEIDKEEDQVWLLSLDGQDYDFGSHNWQAYRKERG